MKNSYILTPFFLDEFDDQPQDLAGPGWQVVKPALSPGTKQGRMVEIYRPLRDYVFEALSAGQRPVSVAGDCCAAIAVFAGLQQAQLNPTLIWLDAHGDFNTWETSPSGFLGGMPLAMLVGRGEQTIVEGLNTGNLAESRVILSDARDLDPGESEAVENSALTHLKDVSDLLEWPLPDGSIWIHFDVDVLNSVELPAVSYPAPGGPSAGLLNQVFERLASTGRVAAVSLSSWNPELDVDGRSRELSMELLEVVAR